MKTESPRKILEARMIAKAWLWMILLLLPGAAFAQGPDDAAVQELYLKSGMEKQVEQVPVAIQSGFDREASGNEEIRKLPAHLVAAMKALAPQAFAPQVLKKNILAGLKAKLAASDVKDVLKWLDSPPGKRITQLEEAASTPEGYGAMREYAARLQNAPPDPKRLDLLRKLDSAIQGTQSAIDITIQTQMAITLAILATLPVEQQRPLEDVARDLEKLRPVIEADVKAETLLSMLYTYRPLADEEIRRYIDFLMSPAGSKYQSAATAAFKKAFFESSVRWGKAIGETINRMQGQSET